MTLGATARTVAAALLAAATVVLLPQAPAGAAACGGSSGVTVVVDSNELGAGISAGCDAAVADGDVAAKIFADAGYTIEYSQAAGMNGFVCKVNGNPADGNCTETHAYWSLWWSDGTSGTWVYANRGVGGLKVPDGGYVAFAWHQGSGRAAPPDVAPTPRVVEAKPTPAPSAATSPKSKTTKKAKPTPKPSPSASPTPASPPPSASETATTEPLTDAVTASTGTAEPTATEATSDLPSIDEITEGPEATSAESRGDDEDGFPAWLGIGLVVVVLGAAAAVPVLRRRGR